MSEDYGQVTHNGMRYIMRLHHIVNKYLSYTLHNKSEIKGYNMSIFTQFVNTDSNECVAF